MAVIPLRHRAASTDLALKAVFHAVRATGPVCTPLVIQARERRTNARLEVRYSDGRTLVVKVGDEEWRRQRFAASRAACGLLLRRTGIVVPDPLPLDGAAPHPPTEAYWKIEAPTLAEVWPRLDGPARGRALRTWGDLLRRVHRVRPRGHGPLPAAERQPGSLEAHLSADLGERLLPAVRQTWPLAADVVERLAEAVPAIAARATDPVLLHGDPHHGNVLCRPHGRRYLCMGLLDLEAAWAGPPEADVAVAELIHGPLFDPLPAGWTEEFRRGYRAPLDAASLAFYRAMHLANLGYHAALMRLEAHAADVLADMRASVAALRRQLRPSASLRAAGPLP